MNQTFFLRAAAVCCAALILSSCGKAGLFRDGMVHFSVDARGGGPFTRASFSGETGADGIERIDWQRGDLIRICSRQALPADGEGTPEADYRISSVHSGSEANHASIERSGNKGLAWGTGNHDFYAVYPSPSIMEGTSLEYDVYTGSIPTTQTLVWKDGTGVPSADGLVLLAAAKEVEEQSNVHLVFQPAFTALEFNLSLEDKNPVYLAGCRLESAGGPVSGTFSLRMGQDTGTGRLTDHSTVTPVEGSTSVTVPLDQTLTRDHPVTFTLLCLPLELSGLQVVFDTVFGTKTLILNRKDGSPLSIPAGTKARISGIVMPGAPDITFTIDSFIPWSEEQTEREAESPFNR